MDTRTERDEELEDQEEELSGQMSFLDHLEELRQRRERGLEQCARDAGEERRDDHDPEHCPAVPADELTRAAKGRKDAGLLDDDHRRDDRPDRDQEEPRDDQEQETECDPEAGE